MATTVHAPAGGGSPTPAPARARLRAPEKGSSWRRALVPFLAPWHRLWWVFSVGCGDAALDMPIVRRSDPAILSTAFFMIWKFALAATNCGAGTWSGAALSPVGVVRGARAMPSRRNAALGRLAIRPAKLHEVVSPARLRAEP